MGVLDWVAGMLKLPFLGNLWEDDFRRKKYCSGSYATQEDEKFIEEHPWEGKYMI